MRERLDVRVTAQRYQEFVDAALGVTSSPPRRA
jgi:hypothetical protein